MQEYRVVVPREKRYFILSLLLLPILFMYATPIPGFTVGDAFFVLSFSIMVIKGKGVRIQRSIIPILIYVVTLTFFCILEGSLQKPTTSLRYIIYLIGVAFMPSIEQCGDYVHKTLNRIGYFIMIILIIQFVALTFFDIIVPGLLTFLPLTDTDMHNYSEGFEIAGRCMSVFAEPSHYAIYSILFLSYKLFENKGLTLKALIIPIVISLSIIMCASFTGFICMIGVWGLKLIRELKNGNIAFWMIVPLALASFLILAGIAMTSSGSYLTNSEVYDNQSVGRFAGYSFLLEEVGKTPFSLLFGHGMNDIAELEYLPGWPRLLYYYGIIGGLIYIISFLRCARKGSFSMVLMIVIAGLMVGTEMNFSSFIMPYMTVVVSSKKAFNV